MGSSGIHNVKIARATPAYGRALVGLTLSPTDVPSVKQRFGIGTPPAEASSAEILGLLAGGAVIELDNGWQLAQSRIVPTSPRCPVALLPLGLRPVRGNHQP